MIQGLRVETTTAVKQGDFIMGDFSYLNIRDLWELSITLGWENDDFRKNIVTVIAEKRLMCYIKSQYKTAFGKGHILYCNRRYHSRSIRRIIMEKNIE